jgi:Holliday junction resolvase
MKIKTINGETVDTVKLADLKSQFIETMESNAIVDFSKKFGASFFLFGRCQDEGWVKFNIPNEKEFNFLLMAINEYVDTQSGGKYHLEMVPNNIEPTEEI